MRTAFLMALALTGGLSSSFAPADPCALLTLGSILSIAGRIRLTPGVPATLPNGMGSSCHYQWGPGNSVASGHWHLIVTIGEAAKVYPGMDLESIAEGFAKQTRVDSANASLVSGAGDAAVYRSVSPDQVDLTAYVKHQVLHLALEGPAARSKREQAIALLKLAAGQVPSGS